MLDSTDTLARTTIRALLDGSAPNGIDPHDCGAWHDVVTALYDAYAAGGTSHVLITFNALVRMHRDLGVLVAMGDDTPAAVASESLPALGPAIHAIDQSAAPCGAWLDTYIAYALNAAPMTPRSFHEIAALIAVSAAIAGRLHLPLAAQPLYPNLYALFIAPSTIAHKTTGFRLLETVLEKAGIHHVCMPHKAPPEAFVADLDPYKLPGKLVHDMEFYLARRAFAAQRCYIRDEVSALFASMKREFNAGLLELLLGLYDCPPRYEETTISRGDILIERGYMSFFGATTPIELAPHLAHIGNWTNGLWARFALITVDQPSPFVFFPQAVEGIQDVANGLRRIYRLFQVPHADMITDDESGEQRICITGVPVPAAVQLEQGVWEAWESYTAELYGVVCRGTGDLDEAMYANYGRFGSQAMKVAMLLATMDTHALPVRVECRHFARAQAIVETWRQSLHRVWSDQSMTQEARLMARIQQRLERAAHSGMSVRDLCMAMRSPSKDVRESLTTLEKSGHVIAQTIVARNGRTVEVWIWQR